MEGNMEKEYRLGSMGINTKEDGKMEVNMEKG